MQVILLFLHAHITSIKTTIFCTLYCVSNYISRKMSVSHDITQFKTSHTRSILLFSLQFAQSFQTLSCLPYAFSFLRTVFSMVSDSLLRFIVFPHKLHSAFRLDRKTCEQRSHVFRLTGTAASQCGHTF